MARRTRVPSETVSDSLLIGLCEGYLAEGWSADRAAAWLRMQDPRLDVNRTRVFGLIGEARRRGLMQLQVRSSLRLGAQLAAALEVGADRVRVVDAYGEVVIDQVAQHGAEVVEGVIAGLHRQNGHERPLRIGLGGGHMLRKVANQLATRLARAGRRGSLAIHALSSGFDPLQPQYAPVTFLGAFESVADELVGLFSSGVITRAQAGTLQHEPGVSESFRLAEQIDVVVTSLASAHDPTGALNRFLRHGDHPDLEESRRKLLERGWVGDVVYEPYDAHGPIQADLPLRPVSVLGIDRLRERTGRPDKAVVLVAGPSESGRSKADALMPLLTQPALRVWTHLVVDTATADQVLRQLAAL